MENECAKILRLQNRADGPSAAMGCPLRTGRFEVTTAGFDGALQLVGGDPYGTPDFTGLIVPSTPTAALGGFQFRYLFMLARAQFNTGERVRLRGLRQYVDIIGTTGGDEAVTIGPLQVTSPMWRLPDGNISWHVMIGNKRWIDTRSPANADSLMFRDSPGPSLLFEVPPSIAYMPPNAGRPWGKPIASDLGNIHDLRYPWRDSQVELELDIPLPAPCDVSVYASVFQGRGVAGPCVGRAGRGAITRGQVSVGVLGCQIQPHRCEPDLSRGDAEMSGCTSCVQMGRPQGPTDPGIRCAACAWVKALGVSGQEYCQTCQLARNEMIVSNGSTPPIFISGRPACGFGVGAADAYSTLTSAQQTWVQTALFAWVTLPATVQWLAGTNGACTAITTTSYAAAAACFQTWFNSTAAGGSLQTTGVIDSMTLAALVATAANAPWGTTIGACPGNCGLSITPAPASSSNTTTYVIAGVAVAAAGGAIYWLTRKKKSA